MKPIGMNFDMPPPVDGMGMGMGPGMDFGMPSAGEITAAELDYYQRLYESMYGPPPGMNSLMGPMNGFGPGGLPSVSQLMHMAMTTPFFPFGKTIKKRRPCIRRKPRRPNAMEGSLYYNKKNRLYEVRICDKGKQVYLGQFESEKGAETTLKEARAAKLKGPGGLTKYKEELKRRKSLMQSGKNQKRNARGHFVRQRSAKPPSYLADLPLRTSRGNPREADIDELLVRKDLKEPGKKEKKEMSPGAIMLDPTKGFSIIDLESPASLRLRRPIGIKTED